MSGFLKSAAMTERVVLIRVSAGNSPILISILLIAVAFKDGAIGSNVFRAPVSGHARAAPRNASVGPASSAMRAERTAEALQTAAVFIMLVRSPGSPDEGRGRSAAAGSRRSIVVDRCGGTAAAGKGGRGSASKDGGGRNVSTSTLIPLVLHPMDDYSNGLTLLVGDRVGEVVNGP